MPSKIYEYGIVAILSGPLFKEAVRVSNEGKGVIFSMGKNFLFLPHTHSPFVSALDGTGRGVKGGRSGEEKKSGRKFTARTMA